MDEQVCKEVSDWGKYLKSASIHTYTCMHIWKHTDMYNTCKNIGFQSQNNKSF